MPASRPSSSMRKMIGYTGTELQDAINGDAEALAKFETIRAHGAAAHGPDQAHRLKPLPVSTPRRSPLSRSRPITFLPAANSVAAADIDLLVRAMSMGKLHHAMMGTAAVAIGTAAAIPGTLVNLAAGGGERNSQKAAVRFGHPSGTLRVGAEASQSQPGGEWSVTKAIMSRSARVLMEGWVRVPGDAF